MILDVGLDRRQHIKNDPDIHGLRFSEHGKGHTEKRKTNNRYKIPHQRNYTGNLSLVSTYHSLLLSVTN